MTTRQLAAMTRREAKRLGLAHWTLEVSFEPAEELVRGGQEMLGLTFINPEYQQAIIQIAKTLNPGPSEYGPGGKMTEASKEAWRTLRETIVHELLHVRLEGHRPQPRYDPAYELGLNVLAGLLVKR